eukprot:4364266-Pyramimonas_sp.AAC.1
MPTSNWLFVCFLPPHVRESFGAFQLFTYTSADCDTARRRTSCSVHCWPSALSWAHRRVQSFHRILVESHALCKAFLSGWDTSQEELAAAVPVNRHTTLDWIVE